MDNKYVLTDETIEYEGHVLHRIKKEETLGGWVESEDNLSHEGKCWISGHAKVFGNSRVSGDALISDYAVVENATIEGRAIIRDYAKIKGCYVDGQCYIGESAELSGYFKISMPCKIVGNALIKSEDDFMMVSGIGANHGEILFYRTFFNEIYVTSDTFDGTINKFKKYVQGIHKRNKYAKEYFTACKLAKIHFNKTNPEINSHIL